MKNSEKHIDPEIRIVRYLSGEADLFEIKWLEEWVLEKEENKKLYLQMRQSWNLAKLSKETLPGVKSGWEAVQKQMDQRSVSNVHQMIKPRSRIFTLGLRVAAAVLILVVAGFWIYQNSFDTKIEHFTSQAEINIAELSDGSVVSLNRYSEISFEQKMLRQATLKGNAYFEVKEDKDHPFVIDVGELKIKVLGTAFYVKAMSDEPVIEVMVHSGKVQVNSISDSLFLTKGEKAVFSIEEKTMTSLAIEDMNYLSWKTREMVFEDMNLIEVIAKINEVYNSNILLEKQELEKCKITVTFKQQELDSILAIIATQFDLKVEEKEESFILTGDACN